MGLLLVEFTQRRQAQAKRCGLHVNGRAIKLAQHLGDGHFRIGRSTAKLLAVARRGVLIFKKTVQVRRVRRINADLQRLQPVALKQALEGKGVRAGGDKAIELRKRRWLAFAQIGKDDAGALYHLVSLLLDGTTQAAAFRLGRGLQAVTTHIKQPAVKRTAQAPVFHPAKGQICATVRAIAVQHAQLALLITKQHKVLPHQAHRTHRALTRQLIGQCHRLPVTAQQLASRRLRADTGYQIILFCADHGDLPFLVCIKLHAINMPIRTSLSRHCIQSISKSLIKSNLHK